MSDPCPQDQAYLRTRLEYDPETGWLTWKPTGFRTWDLKHAGKRAGCVNHHDGYRNVSCQGQRTAESRIIWTLVNGPIPEGMYVDHINCDRQDNRLCNLRLATRSQNMQNCRPRSRCGLPKGVIAKRSKFEALISDNGTVHRLGIFDTAEAAHQAYVEAAQQYHREFSRTS